MMTQPLLGIMAMRTLVVLAACAGAASAALVPNPLFSDHAVLQSGARLPVWGTADPAERVTVELAGQTVSGQADGAGRWRVQLAPVSGQGPWVLKVSGDRGEPPLAIQDVLIGEVWLGSGQSNMDFSVSSKVKYFAGTRDEAQEIAAANYPEIRMFVGDPIRSATPKTVVPGHWEVCSPASVPAFSAVGYFFARDLQRVIHRPIGMVILSYGASTAEAWVSREALAADPELAPMLAKFDGAMAAYALHRPTTRPAALAAPIFPPEARPAEVASRQPPKPGDPGPAAAPAAPKGMRRARVVDPDPSHNQHNPTVLFNGMIAPVSGYAIRGALWYQGESIVGGAAGRALYPRVQAALVRDWRKRWGQGDFPFYIVQLAGQEAESNSPWMREAQASILSLPNTAMAVAYDIGEPHNVHPKNKQEVGDRLARLATHRIYGLPTADSGPELMGWRIDGDSVLLNFACAEGMKPGRGALGGFEVAGSDRRFHTGKAVIQGQTIVVSSEQVPAPESVRYAWSNYPAGANLVNGAGLPAAPFRTDSW